MRAVFGEQNLRQELRPRAPACDRMRWRRCFRDPLAGAAGEGLAHMLDHLPLRRHVLQRFGDVLAELADAITAAVAADAWRCVHHAFARQVRRQRTPRRFLCLRIGLRRRVDRGGDLALRHRGNQFAELQLQLIEQAGALFRRDAMRVALQLGDGQFQMSDLAVEIERARFSFVGSRISRDQQCRQRGNIRRQFGGIESHADDLHCFALSGDLRPIGFLWSPPIDAFQHVAELRWRDVDRAIRRRRPNELAAFQPLRENAGTLPVVPDHLDQVTTTPTKHEQMASVRIVLEFLLHQQRQPRKAAPHVGMPGRQPHAHTGREQGSRFGFQCRDDRDKRIGVNIGVDAHETTVRQLNLDP